MPRAFTSADVVQHNEGATTALIDPGVGLTSPAVGGNGGVLAIFVAQVLAPPAQWHMVASGTAAPGTPLLGIMCRADLPEGDQSWAFQAVSGTGTGWAWVAEEWTNLSYAPLLGGTETVGLLSATFRSTGTTGTWDAPYAVGIAACGMLSGTGSAVWPTTPPTWSNGFVETDVVSAGTGATNGDVMIRVARRYGDLGDTGGWETTCTFGAAQTGRTVYACMAAFRAESLLGDI